ncbi:MAG: pyruvate formate lyase family protein [Eubacteriales bacterium]|nr:pyruvate formate lyase family protein [Eubacteriales bacterium]
MTDYIKNLYDRFIVNKEHFVLRGERHDPYELAEQYSAAGLSDNERSVRRLQFMLESEKPAVWADEKIAIIRTVPVVQEIFTKAEWEQIREKYFVHEQGKVFNIAPEYDVLISRGFDAQKEIISAELGKENLTSDEKEFLEGLIRTLDVITAFADRYAEEAKRVGNEYVAKNLSKLPRKGAETFGEALQFLRLLHYCLWDSFNYHNTIGRMDQFLLPYLKKDLASGISMETEQELLEEFFLSCNKDSDLYTGMQQGDNGQTVMLGGLNPDGTDSFNELSEMCLKACEDLRLIDPKINLRVNKNTPLSLYERGTRLTKLGLGFPQYANDDVVIPCLLHWGYDKEDAYNYSCAACWEFIVPATGMDVPNVDGLSFSAAMQKCVPELEKYSSFDELLSAVKENITRQAEELIAPVKALYMEPAPLMSMMMRGCVENHKDISFGGKYNNFGLHGTGLATAVDSLAAIREFVFDKKKYTAEEIKTIVAADFEGYDEALHDLRYEAPKMGNDDDAVDGLATELLDAFADALEGKVNCRGGIWRAGTGSAMYYVWHAKDQNATPDGRRKGEGLACNYSPSLFARCKGPVSIVKSFAKPHLDRVSNGGPLTIELHDSIFRNDESISKVAMFVKSFFDLGGHQMQINAVNRDKLKDAKLHPENYKNLIVRVWGWSGYFVELDECYQDHIIERMELSV